MGRKEEEIIQKQDHEETLPTPSRVTGHKQRGGEEGQIQPTGREHEVSVGAAGKAAGGTGNPGGVQAVGQGGGHDTSSGKHSSKLCLSYSSHVGTEGGQGPRDE